MSSTKKVIIVVIFFDYIQHYINVISWNVKFSYVIENRYSDALIKRLTIPWIGNERFLFVLFYKKVDYL